MESSSEYTAIIAARDALSAGAFDDATSLAREALALAGGRNADAWGVLTAAAARTGRGAAIAGFCREAFAAVASLPQGNVTPPPRGPWRVAELRHSATPVFRFSNQTLVVADRPKDALQPTAFHLSNVHILPMIGWAALQSDGALILHGLTINPRLDADNRRKVLPLRQAPVMHEDDRIFCIGGSTNYYHATFDYLARMAVVKTFFGPVDGWKLGLPMSLPGIAEMAALIGIPTESIVDLDPGRAHHFANVVVLSNTSAFGHIHPQALHLIRRCIPRRRTAATGLGRRLYLTRRDAATRKILNEEDLLPHVTARGFEVIECGRLSVAEQIALFADADAIVAPHGAALANLVWCEPGTKVIELLPHGMPLGHFKLLSEKVGLSYSQLRAPSYLTCDPQNWQTDYSIPPQDLVAVLDAAGIHA